MLHWLVVKGSGFIDVCGEFIDRKLANLGMERLKDASAVGAAEWASCRSSDLRLGMVGVFGLACTARLKASVILY